MDSNHTPKQLVYSQPTDRSVSARSVFSARTSCNPCAPERKKPGRPASPGSFDPLDSRPWVLGAGPSFRIIDLADGGLGTEIEAPLRGHAPRRKLPFGGGGRHQVVALREQHLRFSMVRRPYARPGTLSSAFRSHSTCDRTILFPSSAGGGD